MIHPSHHASCHPSIRPAQMPTWRRLMQIASPQEESRAGVRFASPKADNAQMQIDKRGFERSTVAHQ